MSSRCSQQCSCHCSLLKQKNKKNHRMTNRFLTNRLFLKQKSQSRTSDYNKWNRIVSNIHTTTNENTTHTKLKSVTVQFKYIMLCKQKNSLSKHKLCHIVEYEKLACFASNSYHMQLLLLIKVFSYRLPQFWPEEGNPVHCRDYYSVTSSAQSTPRLCIKSTVFNRLIILLIYGQVSIDCLQYSYCRFLPMFCALWFTGKRCHRCCADLSWQDRLVLFTYILIFITCDNQPQRELGNHPQVRFFIFIFL